MEPGDGEGLAVGLSFGDVLFDFTIGGEFGGFHGGDFVVEGFGGSDVGAVGSVSGLHAGGVELVVFGDIVFAAVFHAVVMELGADDTVHVFYGAGGVELLELLGGEGRIIFIVEGKIEGLASHFVSAVFELEELLVLGEGHVVFVEAILVETLLIGRGYGG